MRILEFTGNEAHSNRLDGIRLYRLDRSNEEGINIFYGLKVWRNNVAGIRITASEARLAKSTIAENRLGNVVYDGYDVELIGLKIYGRLAASTIASTTPSSPFGIMLTGSRITIEESIITGHHAVDKRIASADIIHNPRQAFPIKIEITIKDTTLGSDRKIIFGYPLNGESYIKLINVNGESYTLYRYDTSYCEAWRLDINSMALKCPAKQLQQNTQQT